MATSENTLKTMEQNTLNVEEPAGHWLDQKGKSWELNMQYGS